MSKQEVPDDPCARAEQWLPDYWQDELSSDDRAWLEKHLETCAECAELAALWRELGQLPEAKPDPLQRRRFEAMLAAYSALDPAAASRRKFFEGWPGWLRPLPAALGLVLLLAGFGSGWWLRGNRRSDAQNQAEEIAALHDEVRATDELVVLSMLQQQSTNDRLEGVSYSKRLSQPDPQILQALLHSLQYDPSPDVRLAALDALQRAGNAGETASEITRGLVDAFRFQKSPLVQVAMVDSFVELRPAAARALLEEVSGDPTYHAEVRQRAAWALSRWN